MECLCRASRWIIPYIVECVVSRRKRKALMSLLNRQLSCLTMPQSLQTEGIRGMQRPKSFVPSIESFEVAFDPQRPRTDASNPSNQMARERSRKDRILQLNQSLTRIFVVDNGDELWLYVQSK